MIDYMANFRKAIERHKAGIQPDTSILEGPRTRIAPLTGEVITEVKTFRDTPYAFADTQFDSFVKRNQHDPNFRVTTMNREVNCGVEITITYTHTKGML